MTKLITTGRLVFLTIIFTAAAATGCSSVKGAESPAAKAKGSYEKALASLRSANYDEVADHLKAALAHDPRYLPAHRLYQDVRLRLVARIQAEDQEAYEKQVYHLVGQYKLLASKHADDALYRHLFARVLLKVGDKQYAERETESAIRLDPNFAPALLLKGYFLLAHPDRRQEARRFFEKAHELDAASSDVVSALAMTETEMPRALELLQKACDLDPSNTVAFLNMARIHANRDDYKKALKEIENALSQDPETEEAHMMRGVIYERVGEIDKALKEFERETALHTPFAPESSFRAAEIYAKRKEYDKAVERLNWAIKWSPDEKLVEAAKKALEIVQSLQKDNSQ